MIKQTDCSRQDRESQNYDTKKVKSREHTLEIRLSTSDIRSGKLLLHIV